MPTILSKKPSLLNHLKKIKNSELRVIELENLIKKKELKNFELESVQLKAILFLFPKLDRFNAFKLLIKHFEIKLSALSEPEIKDLTTCLSQDPAFNNLLPFAKKNFGEVFPAKQNVKRVMPYSIPKRTAEGIYDACKHIINSKQASDRTQTKATNRNRLSLAELRFSILQQCPEAESRLKFFNHAKIKNYETIIPSMKIEEFKNFIEIFPPHDVIKFLNLSLIRKQIEDFQRHKLSEESYIDLLNYFKPYQKDAVKKLLRPISPIINTKLLNLGIFQGYKAESGYISLPDVIPSNKTFRTR